ncbi:hypothetical protein OXB_1422 [Bacillus sp. OxB-1]|nr:hypothetical protein OXB_1422 [Bacillus sp. OxB-1]
MVSLELGAEEWSCIRSRADIVCDWGPGTYLSRDLAVLQSIPLYLTTFRLKLETFHPTLKTFRCCLTTYRLNLETAGHI